LPLASASAVAVAVAVAFALALAVAFALAFLVVIPEANLLLVLPLPLLLLLHSLHKNQIRVPHPFRRLCGMGGKTKVSLPLPFTLHTPHSPHPVYLRGRNYISMTGAINRMKLHPAFFLIVFAASALRARHSNLSCYRRRRLQKRQRSFSKI